MALWRQVKAPWRDKTGLAKWVAIFATTLGIATGLCGLNFIGVLFLVPLSGGNAPAKETVWDWVHEVIADLLTIGAYVEVFVIASSLVALLVLAIIMITRQFTGSSSE